MIREDLLKYKSKNLLVRICVNNFLRQVVFLIKGLDIKNILDIGCGSGFVIQRILQTFDSSIHIDGVDNDQQSLDAARKLNPSASFFLSDIYNLQINNSYDLVMCLEVLEHLTDYHRALKEIKRVTRRYCLISVPHEPYFRLGEFLRGKHLKRFGDPPGHLHHWSRKGFYLLIKKYFKIKEFKTSFPWQIALCEI